MALVALGLSACGAGGAVAPATVLPPTAASPAALPTGIVIISTSTPAPSPLPPTPLSAVSLGFDGAQAAATPLPSLTPTDLPTPLSAVSPRFDRETQATPTATATAEPLPTPDAQAQSRQARVPILMYHYVEPWPAGADEIRKNLTVRPEDFTAQMEYLHQQGYETVSLYDLVYALTLGRPLPPKAVIVTFDDGYRSLPQYAVPVMERYGYRGTIFVITEFMDNGLPAYLTWPQAESLYAQGWKIEPHSKSHEEMAGRDRAFQLYQMLGSIQTVAAHIGVQPRFFCYPSGKYDDTTLKLARELNLWGAVTVDFGRTHTVRDLYTLTRVRVSGPEKLSEFMAGVTVTP
jgi:peptidoglycan/xylan/chitin deacetylase (PgdA/CDA1 family)